MTFVEPPWSRLTPQTKGRLAERDVVKQRGGRVHPGSGSGNIAFDGSSDTEVIEAKQAAKVYSLSRSYVARLFTTAVRLGKEPVMVVDFPGYRCVISIERTRS